MRFDIEKIYQRGRDGSLWMAQEIFSLSDYAKYPRLTDFINDSDFPEIYHDAEEIIQKALDVKNKLSFDYYAFDRMVELYRKEKNLAYKAHDILLNLKNSELYKKENGIFLEGSEMTKTHIENISGGNIAIQLRGTTQNIILNENNIFNMCVMS